MDDRLDDVGRLVVVELDDELAEVGLEALDAVLREKRIEMDFLRRHRLRFRQLRDVVAAQDGEDGLASRHRRIAAKCTCTPRAISAASAFAR